VTDRDTFTQRQQSIGRPAALDQSKVALAQRMHASGESASMIASTLGVSRATAHRVLAVQGDSDRRFVGRNTDVAMYQALVPPSTVRLAPVM